MVFSSSWPSGTGESFRPTYNQFSEYFKTKLRFLLHFTMKGRYPLNLQYFLDIPVILPGNIRRTYDLIVPQFDSGSAPLLIWIHGGGWAEGEKRIGNSFERFCFRGYAVLSVDYRFSGDAPFPAQLIDCKTAVRWARAHAEQYRYNADRIIVGGASAGGHLASLMGTTNYTREFDLNDVYSEFSSNVQGVVTEYGPSDLMPLLFGNPEPALKRRLLPMLKSASTSLADMAAWASPITHITGNEPPFLITHGADDPVVPVSQSRNFYHALREAGVNAVYYEDPVGQHGFDSVGNYEAVTDFILHHLPTSIGLSMK